MDIIGQNGNDGLHYDITDQDLIDDEDFEIEEEILNELDEEKLPEPREENDPAPKKLKPPTSRAGIRIG